jgi:hypothetical protein
MEAVELPNNDVLASNILPLFPKNTVFTVFSCQSNCDNIILSLKG